MLSMLPRIAKSSSRTAGSAVPGSELAWGS